ncbi:hypothetical protein CMQ_7323 [Grosmannia clavigera kw1407]|uniref:Tat pathway signal sequence n=1 Tax=Grosmannia clavigera (strain kw1407 / UAMH 11150) TaxID=655863 RepID=F0XPN3_GROCL|nr:uncharacterized protein CMQ_7323 [Grosmannia clavigera kw1407]EFX00321.1 hypothetical protein CMQ_7323 [Grosmannia clavigera kw1407]
MPKLYHSVPLDEEKDGASFSRTLSSDSDWDGVIPKARRQLSSHWSWLIHAVLLTVSGTLFAVSFCARTAKPDDTLYTKLYSSYSPAANVVKYETTRFTNLTPVVEGPFVGYGPEVDLAWDYIANDIGDTMISEKELDDLGLPRNSLKIAHPKTGEVGYRAALEVFHQLHCLNLVRQAVYKDYYKEHGGDVGEAESKEDLMGHVDHCIETLRTNLMCQSDIGVFTFKLFPEYGFPDDDYWPDFNTLHTCRNFEAIRTWAVDHTVSWDHNV